MRDITNLPAWAQNEIRRLAGNLADAEAKLRQMDSKEATNVFIWQGVNNRPLPRDSRIEFDFGEARVTCKIQDDGNDGPYLLLAEDFGQNLYIGPSSYNTARVYANRKFR